MRKVEIGNYLVIDPEICHGQMTFKGTRVLVETVLTFLARGYSVDQLLRSWPELTPDQHWKRRSLWPPSRYRYAMLRATEWLRRLYHERSQMMTT